jgi:hypothetical protein
MSAVHFPTQPPPRFAIGRQPRYLRQVGYAGLAVVLGGCLAAALLRHSTGGGHALAFGLAPDLALVYGAAPGLAKGRLHPRAVPLYNALHAFTGRLLLAGAAVLGSVLGWPGLDLTWIIGALAWATHIAVDRAVGYGPRSSEGLQRG